MEKYKLIPNEDITRKIYWCERHMEYFSNNCSECMLEANDPDTRKKAIREVVEWLNEPCPHNESSVEVVDSNGDVIGERIFSKRECYECWQAQLKTWRVER